VIHTETALEYSNKDALTQFPFTKNTQLISIHKPQ
jgi:hypothetical protein